MVASVLRANLCALAAARAKADGVKLSAISKRYYGSTTFFDEFKAGRCTITLDKFEQVYNAMVADWSANAPWPFLRPAIMERPKTVSSPRKKIPYAGCER